MEKTITYFTDEERAALVRAAAQERLVFEETRKGVVNQNIPLELNKYLADLVLAKNDREAQFYYSQIKNRLSFFEEGVDNE